jgi:8-oxo-dGTP diphosphatase
VTSEAPVRRQRLAAYAVVLRAGDEVLLTQLSALTTAPGRWTLPGGGIDHGEHPADAVAREGLEETGLTIEVGQLLGVDSRHIVGTSPRGVLEDYHVVRLIYAGTVPADAPAPEVVEVDGTTAAVAWHPLDAVSSGAVDAVELVQTAIALLTEATHPQF